MNEKEDVLVCEKCGCPIDDCECSCPYCGESKDCECCIGDDKATGG